MKKISPRRKKWLIKYSIKKLELKSKKKVINKYIGLKEYEINNSNNNKKKLTKRNEFTLTSPEILSVEKNTEETINYFNLLIKKRDENKFNSIFKLDLSNVKKVSADALMYILAIMKDTKYNKKFNNLFKGNFPSDSAAYKFFVKSGFLDFVSTNEEIIKPQSDNIKIIMGKNVDPDTVKRVCDFVHNTCNLSRIDTFPLYELLIELMNNTKQHAYKSGSGNFFSANSWFIYAEKRKNSVNFVFLDTGLGIPYTVLKKWKEKIPYLTKDSEFICSALRGEFRSETNQSNRGKGLPQILECCNTGLIDNALIYSGKGYCKILKDNINKFDSFDINTKIFGTLFSWDINIVGDKYD